MFSKQAARLARLRRFVRMRPPSFEKLVHAASDVKYIDLEGTFEIPKHITHEQFLDMLTDWLESQGMAYGGSSKEQK